MEDERRCEVLDVEFWMMNKKWKVKLIGMT